MADPRIQLVIEARNNATQILDQFGRQIRQATEQVEASARRQEASFGRLDREILRTGRNVRFLTTPLVNELSPALDQTTARMTSVLAASVALGSGWGAVALAGAGLAGVVGGTLLSAWQKSREAAESFARAIDSIDASVVTTELGKARKAADETAAAFAKAMQDAGNPCTLVSYDDQGHGFFNYGRARNAMFTATLKQADRFLAGLGYLKGEPTLEDPAPDVGEL